MEGPLEGNESIKEPKKVFPVFKFVQLSLYAGLTMFQPFNPFLVPFFVQEKGLTEKEVR